MAPEVHQGKYGKKCDVWSLGIMLYVMLTGSFPFKGETEEEKLTRIRVGQVNLASQEWQKLKSRVKGRAELEILIAGMLNINVEKRYTAAQALS